MNSKQEKPLTDQEKQYQPLRNEFDPKDAKAKIFMAAQKAKRKFKIKP